MIVLSIISIYYTFKFFKYRRTDYVARRHPTFVIFLAITLFIIVWSRAFLISSQIFSSLESVLTPQKSDIIFSLPFLTGYLFTIRSWIVYFEFQHGLNSVELKWRLKISDDIPWTHKPFAKYIGNKRSCAIFAIVVWICGASLKYLFFDSRLIYWSIQYGSIAMVLVLLISLIYGVERSCRDILGIHGLLVTVV